MRTDYTVAQHGDWETVATLVAQRLLNANMDRDPNDKSPPVKEDGRFGDQTLQAVKRFQKKFDKAHPSGVVGPNTFEKLGLKTVVSWPVHLRSQPHGGQCWSAAASMLLGGVVPGPGLASTVERGALVDTDANVKLFARSLGWDYIPAQSMADIPITNVVRAPLWIGGNSVNKHGKLKFIHAVILGGIYSYEWAGDSWVVLKIYDPYPYRTGRIIFVQYETPTLPDHFKFYVRWFLSPKSFGN